MIPKTVTEDSTGRLFLVGDERSVSDMFSGQQPPSQQTISNFHSNIEARADLCLERRLNYAHYVMPDPLVFYPEMESPERQYMSYYRQYFERSGDGSVIKYPLNDIRPYPDRQLKTDTHYSPLGYLHIAAKVASEMLELDTSAAIDDAVSNAVSKTYSGDLAVQCDPVPVETVLKPKQVAGLVYGSNGLEAGNTGIIDIVSSPNAMTERRLLIFGDSFFHGMLSELARYWGEIFFISTPFLHTRFVDAVAPDDVLSGMAERYLSKVSSDLDAPDPLSMPLTAGRKTSPTSGFGELFSKFVDVKRLNQSSKAPEAQFEFWPSASSSSKIEETIGLILWMRQVGRNSGLTGQELSDAWADALPHWRLEADNLLSGLQKHHLQIGRVKS